MFHPSRVMQFVINGSRGNDKATICLKVAHTLPIEAGYSLRVSFRPQPEPTPACRDIAFRKHISLPLPSRRYRFDNRGRNAAG